ncbi:transcription-repair coupling factor [Paenalcaligenes faecalis]|uniref:transcription-repair coupling factor n=1 Tax=Paenalcaligenes faecalis TaxID=2980099 RepID=UPI0022B968DC|nr:transcription-repair coupling factor [Paenalcaligenes faecalis]
MSKTARPTEQTLYLSSTQTCLQALKIGQRYQQPLPPGSGDAFLLADLARQSKKTLIIFCADPVDAQRLHTEINQFAPELSVQPFPDWETLAYDAFSPHEDLISTRLRALNALLNNEVQVLTIPVSTALYRLAPPSFLAAYSFSFKQGDQLDEQQLREQMVLANYNHVTQVSAPGEFSVRGGLIDIFPMGSVVPYRLDLFDNEIESIRAFDADTQRSLYNVKQIDLLPGREFPLDEDARHLFRSRFREKFEGDPSKALPYKDIGNGIAFAGIEYYLPLFFEQTATIFDYLPKDIITVTHGAAQQAIDAFHSDAKQRYQFLKSDPERPVLAPEELFLDGSEFFQSLKSFARLDLQSDGLHPDFIAVPNVAVARRAEDPLSALRTEVRDPERRTLLCADSAGRRETLAQMLSEFNLTPDNQCLELLDFIQGSSQFALVTASLFQGFALKDAAITLLTENDLYPHQVRTAQRGRKTQRTNVEAMVRDLSELREGDPVVHTEHGIGRYQGLVEMDLGEGPVELLHLEYANEATLYVPVAQLHVISRYSGTDAESAPLHQLGSGQWEKARQKAAKQARDTAAELLALYAQRALRAGQQYKIPMSDYESFAAGFGFEPTPDQAAAIEAVLDDMKSNQPMDRLICGDVGFGKTEVALRAAFVAVANGKQVAILCPTTLLAEQHAQSFADRFADWPIQVAELSRFRTSKETKAAIDGLASGHVDIVIGTHKLLSKDVVFKELGLVIIDEEHRFGVRQKEAFKALRAEVDMLTLTATPIPRTLGMSLEGIRDFSIIATAPEKRLAIKTFVRREDDGSIREALLRELKRGGQVYFLHNEVDTIENRRARLQELVPEARIGVAHGQMPERELESVMKDFYQKRFNVLLCTTIIETGIDVPTANTIVIQRADKLGLAQLHQLRGRVGRSHHQAYAYLLTPGEDAITSNAKKRLEAIMAMDELGAGFFLAMNDLEIRGAGEVLGEHQSGNIHEIGFSMYSDMLNKAVKSLKAGKEPDLMSPFDTKCEVNLRTPALLPNDFCPDVHARLGFYKKLSHAETNTEVEQIQEELIDRYGLLPDSAKHLLLVHQLRIKGEQLGLDKIDAQEDQLILQFNAKPNVDPVRLIELVQQDKTMRFSGPDKLRVALPEATPIDKRVQKLHQLFKQLGLKA